MSQPPRNRARNRQDPRPKRGARLLRRVLGEAGLRLLDDLEPVCPDLGRFLVEYVFGDIYAHRGLPLRTRELAAVAALAALGHPRPQLKMHIRAALRVGCSRGEILEVLLQTSVFAGFPAALNGMSAAREVFSEKPSLSGKSPRHSRQGKKAL